MWFLLHEMIWKRKLFFILLVCVTLSVVLPAAFVFEKTKEILIEETQHKAMDIALSIAAFLTGDIEEYRSLSEATSLVPGTKEEAYYQKTRAVIETIKQGTDTSFIFTAKYIDAQTNAYVLDGEPVDSEFFSPFGSTDPMNPCELQVYATRQSLASGEEEDPIWGTYLTGYAPIIDTRDDTMVGWVGVDYAAETLNVRYVRISWILGFCFASFILIISTLLYFLIRAIQTKSNVDYLTKLANKRSFTHLLAKLIKEKNSFTLLMCDVDKFKPINDTYGHPVGDMVLIAIAQALETGLELTGKAFRYGGDEFAILLPSCHSLKAQTVLQTVQEHVKAIRLTQLEGTELSVSIGQAQWEEGMQADTLVGNADHDLYEQKRKRRES
jgi:diguanylate cyclase (GGDEF)-like protein